MKDVIILKRRINDKYEIEEFDVLEWQDYVKPPPDCPAIDLRIEDGFKSGFLLAHSNKVLFFHRKDQLDAYVKKISIINFRIYELKLIGTGGATVIWEK